MYIYFFLSSKSFIGSKHLTELQFIFHLELGQNMRSAFGLVCLAIIPYIIATLCVLALLST